MTRAVSFVTVLNNLRFYVAELVTIFGIVQNNYVYRYPFARARTESLREFKAKDIYLTRQGHICLAAHWQPTPDLLYTNTSCSFLRTKDLSWLLTRLAPEIYTSLGKRAKLLKAAKKGDTKAEKLLFLLAKNDYKAIWWSLGIYLVIMLTTKVSVVRAPH